MTDFDEDELEVILEVDEPASPRRLSGWLVLAFSLAITGAYIAGTTIAMIIVVFFKAAKDANFDIDRWVERAQYDAFVLFLGTLGATLLAVPIVWFAASYQKATSAAEYLALRKVSWLSCLSWTGIALLLIAVSDGMTTLIGKAVVPEFMRQVYSSPGAVPWLWIAVIVLAPLIEELIFRGFLFSGLRSNGVGVIATAIVTSLLWAVIHVQYGVYEIGMIFVGGLVLSWARVRTNSIIPCIAMHAVANLVATIEVAILV